MIVLIMQALSSLELMGSRQRKNFQKLFRKYIKHKKDVIDWCVLLLLFGCAWLVAQGTNPDGVSPLPTQERGETPDARDPVAEHVARKLPE